MNFTTTNTNRNATARDESAALFAVDREGEDEDAIADEYGTLALW